MATIISFANQKGGVGKSQCTIMTAAALAASTKNRVLVVDVDKQQSIFRMREHDKQAYGENFPVDNIFDVVAMTAQNFVEQVESLDANYDVIFVDIAGKMDDNLSPELQEVTPVLLFCDVVLVPFLAGNHNMNSSSEFVAFAEKIRLFRQKTDVQNLRPLSIGVFGNRISKDTISNDAIIEMWNMKEMFPHLKIMKTHLKDSNIFKTCDTVTSLYNKSKQAARLNFTAFLDEMVQLFEI